MEVAQHFDKFQAMRAHVVAVSFMPPHRVTAFLTALPLPFPVVSDPERTAYQALSLPRSTWWQFLRLGAGWRFVKLLLRGWIPTKPAPGDDLLQLGGDFVLDAEGRIVFAYSSAEATDRPTISVLLEAVKKAT